MPRQAAVRQHLAHALGSLIRSFPCSEEAIFLVTTMAFASPALGADLFSAQPDFVSVS